MLPESFQHILRVMNTNLEGERKIAYSLTAIKGCGRRYAMACLKKAEIDARKRAGELVRRRDTCTYARLLEHVLTLLFVVVFSTSCQRSSAD